jgi:hypothetical protein
MTTSPLCIARRLAASLAAASAVLLVSACAAGGPTATDGGSAGAGPRSSVEVFGVIDAGVSHTSIRADRR